MWQLLMGFLIGLGSPVRLSASALYRFPHRNSAEALRGDWLRIGKDIRIAMNEEDEDE